MKSLARKLLISIAIFALFVSFGVRKVTLAQQAYGHNAVKVCHAVPEPAHQPTDRYEEIIVDDDGSDGNVNYQGHDHHPKDIIRPGDEECPAILAVSPDPSLDPTPTPSVDPTPSTDPLISPDPSIAPMSSPDPSPSPETLSTPTPSPSSTPGGNSDNGGGGSSDSNTGGLVLGASTTNTSTNTSARVLGARTMASAGSSENLLLFSFIAGSLMSGFGIKMYANTETEKS